MKWDVLHRIFGLEGNMKKEEKLLTVDQHCKHVFLCKKS